jgi:hypothetical protein
MRLHIENDKVKLIDFISNYIVDLLSNRRVELIVNGEKKIGTITHVEIQDDEYKFLSIHLDGKENIIPLLDETKAFLGKEIVSFDSKRHTTIIEFLK